MWKHLYVRRLVALQCCDSWQIHLQHKRHTHGHHEEPLARSHSGSRHVGSLVFPSVARTRLATWVNCGLISQHLFHFLPRCHGGGNTEGEMDCQPIRTTLLCVAREPTLCSNGTRGHATKCSHSYQHDIAICVDSCYNRLVLELHWLSELEAKRKDMVAREKEHQAMSTYIVGIVNGSTSSFRAELRKCCEERP